MRWRHCVLVLFVATSCAAGSAPTLDPIAPQTAVVGVELAVRLRAAGRGGVAFAFGSDLDLDGRRLAPTLTRYADGSAVFRWIPLASDIGEHHLVFSASVDGSAATQKTVPVTVSGDAAPVVFREPLGAGTTLDLWRAACVELDLAVEDAATGAVTLAPGEEWPEGAILTQDGDLTGHVRFCPTTQQTATTSVFLLDFVARDGAGGRADKRYTVVIGPTLAELCARVEPWISHAPAVTPLTPATASIQAAVRAAQAVGAVTSYWAAGEHAAGDAAEVAGMMAVPMAQVWGGAAVGAWQAAPPPALLAAIAPGTSATLSYFIRVEDVGLSGCPTRVVRAPDSGTYRLVVQAAP